MRSKIVAIILFLFAPNVLLAELSKEECARIESLIGKTPVECLSAQTPPSQRTDGTPVGETWQNHIFFPAGGTSLDQQAIKRLELLSEVLKGEVMGTTCLQLIGHSDVSGGTVANERLGRLRAEKVADFLGALLQDRSRVTNLMSYGELRPLPDRAATDKWQRRVEIRARQCFKSV